MYSSGSENSLMWMIFLIYYRAVVKTTERQLRLVSLTSRNDQLEAGLVLYTVSLRSSNKRKFHLVPELIFCGKELKLLVRVTFGVEHLIVKYLIRPLYKRLKFSMYITCFLFFCLFWGKPKLFCRPCRFLDFWQFTIINLKNPCFLN